MFQSFVPSLPSLFGVTPPPPPAPITSSSSSSSSQVRRSPPPKKAAETQAIGANNDEDLYVTHTSVEQMPGFPVDDWKDKPLNPDGTMNRIPRDTPYMGEWLKQWRIREVFVEANLLFQFAQKVAAKTGRGVDQYYRGGASAANAVDTMIVNVLTHALQRETVPAFAEGVVTAETVGQVERTAESLRQAVNRMLHTWHGESLRRGDLSLFGAEQIPREMTPAAREQQEDLIRTALRSFGAGRGGAPGTPAAKQMTRAPVESGKTVPLRGAPPDEAPRREDMLLPPPPPRYTLLSPAEQQAKARAEQSAKTREEGAINDPRVMLTYLMLSGGPSPAQLNALRMLYGDPNLILHDHQHMRELIADAEKLERLLRRGGPGLDWLNAPQHTGYIFFTPNFIQAVEAATSDVHHVCGKPEVLQVDLMTHSEVRDPFAALVAYYATSGLSGAISRYGGGTDMRRDRDRDRQALIQLFRKLGYTMRSRPYAGRFLTFAGVADGVEVRDETETRRRRYMGQNGRYYSDVRQLRSDRHYDA